MRRPRTTHTRVHVRTCIPTVPPARIGELASVVLVARTRTRTRMPWAFEYEYEYEIRARRRQWLR
ncbi:MAG: hypothetical protein HZA54_08010 [Planctomycetes bacterium]|nr:hypothetical protein [Planctomycetota bacterium]